MSRHTIIGIPVDMGAQPSTELPAVDAPWTIEAVPFDYPFDVETYKAMTREEDDEQFRRLCLTLMADMLRDRQERIAARQVVPVKPKRRIPDVVVGMAVAILTALVTFAIGTSIGK